MRELENCNKRLQSECETRKENIAALETEVDVLRNQLSIKQDEKNHVASSNDLLSNQLNQLTDEFSAQSKTLAKARCVIHNYVSKKELQINIYFTIACSDQVFMYNFIVQDNSGVGITIFSLL